MKLKEFEAKQLLEHSGIPISKGVLVKKGEAIPAFSSERFFKVQVLANSRAKNGGVFRVTPDQVAEQAERFFSSPFLGEQVSEILLDEIISIEKEYYLGILFDTTKRTPLLIYSEEGGVDIEQLKRDSPEKITLIPINYLDGIKDYPTSDPAICDIIDRLYACFVEHDCRMIEINPLVKSPKGFVGVDAVAVLDDDARYRWKIPFEERTDGRRATKREIAAHEIDRDDHRGVAGKTFVDLDGDIAILTSGGGATMTIMDALISYGGKPANYTEYSGNPPREKVERLTRIVLDKEGLSGLLIAGVVANFTNIYETLAGVLSVLIEKKPNFPIVVRRVGIDWEKARDAMLEAREKYGLDIHYFDEKTPLSETARLMVELSERYTHEHSH